MRTIRVPFSRAILEDDSTLNNSMIGEVLDTKYKLTKYLGRGGFGKAYVVLEENKYVNKFL